MTRRAGTWPAPVAAGPVVATVSLPGSKSQTNRALVLATLSPEPSQLVAPLRSRDTELMAAGLRAMGADVDTTGDDWWVRPARLLGPAQVDVGNAGTVMRFLPPVAALATGLVRFDGDPRARQRPLAPVVGALRDLGVDVEASHGRLPLTVHGRGWVLGGSVEIDASTSSQFVSALLLAAPRFADAVEVRHVGGRVPSGAHIDMTVAMLRSAGVIVEHVDETTWRVEPGPLRVGRHLVEPDLSNAAAFLAAAVVTGGRVTVPGWPLRTTQAGDALRHLLPQLGASVELDEHGLTVTGPGRVLGADLDLSDVGELAPVLTAVAALADGPSTLRGIGHLRHHETDRLAALSREIGALGGDVRETADGLEVHPRPLHGGRFETYEDHRLATAAAVLGLCVAGVEVVDVATTAKTLPTFVPLWEQMLTARSVEGRRG
ncbi:MAG TPA: 3-phosphoshikimate 1-carboxyvinyltransferase [Actinomycetes bacterium]|nr:3-phosphoshikimate 1-carboxyvinyltransferase [Actinomycetes bacterium]